MDAHPLQRQAAGQQQIAEPAQEILGRVGQAADAQKPVCRRRGRRIGETIHLGPIIEAGPSHVKAKRLQDCPARGADFKKA